MRAFFASFIDMRNLVMTYKQLRWEVREPGLLIAGGRLDRRRLTGIVDRRDTAALIAVAQRVAGRRVSVVASDAALEALLLRTITSALARYRRDEQPVPVLVSYMWRRYIEARNLALLLHATDVEAAALERELIA